MGDTGSKRTGIQYRKVSTQIFADDRFGRLSDSRPNGKTLWLHLLIGKHTTTIPGLSCVSLDALARSLGWSTRDVSKVWKEFDVDDSDCGHEYRMVLADWKHDLIFIPQAIRHNGIASYSTVQGWRSQWNNLPECELKLEAYETILAMFQADKKDDCAAMFYSVCQRPKVRENKTFRSRLDGRQHALGLVTISETVRKSLKEDAGGPPTPPLPTPLPTGHREAPLDPPAQPPQPQEREHDLETDRDSRDQLLCDPPAAVALTDDPSGTPPVLQPQQPTPDRKPRQPKLVLTGEAPSSRKPVDTEHAQIQADLGRWLDRYRTMRGDSKATVPFPVFAQAWKARGIDDLLLALDGLRDDDFSKGLAAKAWLSESMIAKGVNFARNGKPRPTNPYEDNLQSARALYVQAQTLAGWVPPKM